MNEVRLYRREGLLEVAPQILRPPGRKILESTQIAWAHYKHTHVAQPLLDFHEWDWLKKKGAAEFSSLIGLEYMNEIQGLICIADRPVMMRGAAATQGAALYVEYLEVAPWNHRFYAGEEARFLGVGTALLDVAIQMSRQRGCEGRIALHSIPSAREFYLKQGLNEIAGDDSPGLSYFELSTSPGEKP